MSTMIDALTRSLSEALGAYTDFEFNVRPQLMDRVRQRAQQRLDEAVGLYGGHQQAFERMGDEYLKLRKAAGLVVPGTIDEPVTERVGRDVMTTERRPVWRPRPGGAGVPGVGVPPGSLLAPARLTSEAETPVDLEQVEEDVPVTRTVFEERPTGRTRRVLDLPRPPQDLTIDTPAGPIGLGRLRELAGPEGVRYALGLTDPTARARLAFDIENAAVGRALEQARINADLYRHENPSANEQLRAQTDLIEARWRMNQQQLNRALAERNAADLRAYRTEQLAIAREANRIRLVTAQGAAARARTGQMTLPQMVDYMNTLRQMLADEREALNLRPGDPEVQRNIKAIQEEQRIMTELIRAMRPGGRELPPALRLNYPESPLFSLSAGRSLREWSPAGPAPAGAGAASLVTPPPSLPGIRAPGGPAVSYQTRSAGTLTHAQVLQAVDGMIRLGWSRARIADALRGNGIPPEDFGYGQ